VGLRAKPKESPHRLYSLLCVRFTSSVDDPLTWGSDPPPGPYYYLVRHVGLESVFTLH
jgi:hypothetical protein